MKLHDYQESAVERVSQEMRAGHRRVLLQSPVGSGKTVMTSEVVRRAVARGKRVLFLAHRRRLITQKSQKLDAFGIRHGVYMAGERADKTEQVQVASRDTLLSRAFRHRWIDVPDADLVVVDEAHRVLSAEYKRLVDLYPNAFHLGVTATPAREDGKGLGDFYTSLVVAEKIGVLIDRGFLAPVRCFAPQTFQKRTKSKRTLAGDPVSTWQRLGEGRPTVLFAATVKQSMSMAGLFLAAGIQAEHLDAHTPDDEREQIITRVESGKTKILCNCSVLTEGVDIPCLGCIILLRMCRSYVLFIQAVGRVMRRHEGKQYGILLDHTDAVLEHGFPDDDVTWELTESDTIDRRNKRDREEGKRKTPIACPQCGNVYSGGLVCPQCGYKLPRKLVPPTVKNQLLREVERTATPEEKLRLQRRYWVSCLAVALHRDQKATMAGAMFKSRFGVWPDKVLGLTPMPTGNEWYRRVRDLFPKLDKSKR